MTNRRLVTATEELWVARSPEEVFDFTQDYSRRSEWDRGIVAAKVVRRDPPAVRVTMRGLGAVTVDYRLFRRPERTSAAFVDVTSRWISGGGGSWQYEPAEGGTRWRQTNSLELRGGLLTRLLAPVVARSLRSSTRAAMAAAKRRLEASPGSTA